MTVNISKIMDRAKQASLLSDHDRHKLGACAFDKKGRVISTGWNRLRKTHPMTAFIGRNRLQTLHAEINAIVRAKNKDALRGASIAVYRGYANGCMANSEPCETCKTILKAFGVIQVFYTNEGAISVCQL